MDGIIADLVKEASATTGTVLNIALVGDAKFGRFSDVASVGESVYYTIRNGNNSEVGIGTVQAGDTLDRTTPLVTVENGVYNSSSPSRIDLVGASTVAITPNVTAMIDAIIANAPDSNPPGLIAVYSVNANPPGWLACHGAAISRTVYADLFAAIGTSFGAGDGSTTFNLPDLRGEFIRGHDSGRGVDSGRAFGSFQDHAMQDMYGTYRSIATRQAYPTGVLNHIGTQTGFNGGNNPTTSPNTIEFNMPLVANTAAETRPRNVAMRYCIKF